MGHIVRMDAGWVITVWSCEMGDQAKPSRARAMLPRALSNLASQVMYRDGSFVVCITKLYTKAYTLVGRCVL